eukprot:1148059-Pelagomonas_calceolata.AAC.2
MLSPKNQESGALGSIRSDKNIAAVPSPTPRLAHTCIASAPLALTPALGPAPDAAAVPLPPRPAREWSNSRYTSGVTCTYA